MKKSKFINESESDEEYPKEKLKKVTIKKKKKIQTTVFDKNVNIVQPTSLNPFKGINDFVLHSANKKNQKLDTNILFEEKHKPSCSKEIYGHDLNIQTMKNWIENKNSNNFILLYGPSGSGKNIIVRTLLKECDYKIIEFSSEIYPNKKEMFIKLEKILNINSIETLISNSKIAILFTDIDNTLGEGTHYTTFIDTLNKNKPIKIPIICIYHSKKLKKKYNTPTKLDILHIDHVHIDHLVEYGMKVMKLERKTVTKAAMKIVIEKSHFDVRKILQNLRLISISNKKRIGKEEVNKLLKFTGTDIFFGAYEVMDDIFHSSEKRTTNERIYMCHPDQPLITDLLYSNAPYILDTENISSVLDDLSLSDVIQTFIYKEHSFDLRDYLVMSSCISPSLTVINNAKVKKNYVTKRNQLNNLPWSIIKNRNMFRDMSHLPSDIQYMIQNIIVDIIENIDTPDNIIDEKVKYLSSLGINFALYQKIRKFNLNKEVPNIDKNIKKRLEKVFNSYSREK